MILHQVINTLGARFQTAVAPTQVFDGPVPSSVNANDFVLVGSSAEDEDGAVVDLTLSDLGPGTWLDETGEIVCSFWSWSGGTDLAARRASALALASSCAASVHADRTLGGLLTNPGLAEITSFRYEPRQTTEGAICRITFSVIYSHLNT